MSRSGLVVFVALTCGLFVVPPLHGGDPKVAGKVGSTERQRKLVDQRKSNLDLPYSARALAEDDDVPETVTLFGTSFEGDCFIFCVDRSSSMASGEFDVAKLGVTHALATLSEGVEFGLVLFDQGLRVHPENGRTVVASPTTTAGAIAWLASIQVGRGTCVREGVVRAISMANGTRLPRCTIIYSGDGGTTCPGHDSTQYETQTLVAVAAANFHRHRINAIWISHDGNGDDFCRNLAAIGAGQFVSVPR